MPYFSKDINVELSLLSIEAADELEKLKQKHKYNKEIIKDLFDIIKEEFSSRLRYYKGFSNAYFLTFKENNKNLENYVSKLLRNLDKPEILDETELTNTINFCVNLSDSAFIYEEEIKNLRKSLIYST
jgi:hypothetical protein